MLTPGLVPTKTQIRFGSRMSTRGERWAYLEGSAYLLDFRCFFAGRGNAGEVVGAVLVLGEVMLRGRFVDGGRDAGDEVSSSFLGLSP